MAQRYTAGKFKGIDQQRLEAGWLGKFFGMGDHALKNVIGLAAIILLLTILIIVFCIINAEDSEKLINALLIIAPLFTLVVGYIAGAIRK